MGSIAHLHSVETARPFINGASFSDTFGMKGEQINLLADRGVVFVTEFERTSHKGSKTYGGHLIAKDWEAAQALADNRGYGETIIGQLSETEWA